MAGQPRGGGELVRPGTRARVRRRLNPASGRQRGAAHREASWPVDGPAPTVPAKRALRQGGGKRPAERCRSLVYMAHAPLLTTSALALTSAPSPIEREEL